jgi:hypothetical protein
MQPLRGGPPGILCPAGHFDPSLKVENWLFMSDCIQKGENPAFGKARSSHLGCEMYIRRAASDPIAAAIVLRDATSQAQKAEAQSIPLWVPNNVLQATRNLAPLINDNRLLSRVLVR